MIGEASLSETSMAMGYSDDPGGMNINPADYEGLLVRFVMYPHQNMDKTREEGRPIFEDIPYVDIRTPGDRTSHLFRPAARIDTLKWPKHWEAFQARIKNEGTLEGTPLEQWPAITRALVEELKFFNVFTVEQLADLSDTACQNFMGIQAWKDKAQKFLIAADESKAAEELAAKDRKIEDLELRLAAMEERLTEAATEED